ncbi:DUF58 domain-containing protein [Paenibacillus harenae]|uniref:DUF58 domain-containing protein n=1 Tax=Paenibacillus harenae TaxID=306543 RepID=UPI00041545D3|nr:DUF58 domain-containing protein [Paenibacillus harenae]
MNAHFSEDKLQNVNTAADGNAIQTGADAGYDVQLPDGTGRKNGQSAALGADQGAGAAGWKKEPAGRDYKTRWLAWTVITAGWVLSLSAVLLRGGAVEWFLAAVLGFVMLVSGLAPVLAASGLTAVRTLPLQETSEGGRQTVQLTLRRSYFIPFVWFALHDETLNDSSPSNKNISFRTVFTPLLRGDLSVRYTLHKLRRGRHPYEHVTVTVGDWLGLTAIHKKIESRAEFVVLPGLPPEEPGDAAEQAGGMGAGRAKLKMAAAPYDSRGEMGREEIWAAVRAAGIGPDSRPYREGDSLRHLDWRSAAKGRGLQTKLFELERPVQTYIAVDTGASGYDRDDRLFDACLGFAALAVRQAVACGGMVTLVTNQGLLGTSFSPENRDGGADGSALLHAMALLRADGQASMAGMLAGEEFAFSRGGSVLVFTADWRGGRSWGELAGFAADQGCRLELFIVTRQAVPTFAMREQQKWLERDGVKVTWLHVPEGMYELPFAEEGGDAYVYA